MQGLYQLAQHDSGHEQWIALFVYAIVRDATPKPATSAAKSYKRSFSLVQSVRWHTKPIPVNLYEVFCAVLYLWHTGCQWRLLHSDFTKWRTVHSYFAKRSEPDQDGISVVEQILKNQVGAARERLGVAPSPVT